MRRRHDCVASLRRSAARPSTLVDAPLASARCSPAALNRARTDGTSRSPLHRSTGAGSTGRLGGLTRRSTRSRNRASRAANDPEHDTCSRSACSSTLRHVASNRRVDAIRRVRCRTCIVCERRWCATNATATRCHGNDGNLPRLTNARAAIHRISRSSRRVRSRGATSARISAGACRIPSCPTPSQRQILDESRPPPSSPADATRSCGSRSRRRGCWCATRQRAASASATRLSRR